MGTDIPELISDLEEVMEAYGKKLADTLKKSIAAVTKVAEEEDNLFLQLDYKLKHFQATSVILRKVQKEYGSQLDARKARRVTERDIVVPLRDEAGRDGWRSEGFLYNKFQEINARIGEGNNGVEKQIRDLLNKDYVEKAKQLERRRRPTKGQLRGAR